ncbi:MAG: maleylpyruvate isomerase family mycothiol-dependent enzyme [Actinomycetota bacterium]|nr:maleylpyruvate isomerase family mycothiol-dependent enzyme [Actinomycetota bacterium]
MAAAQNSALLRELRALDPEDWNAPTDCERWRVRDIVAHLLGWAEFFTSTSELRHQLRAFVPGKRDFPTTTDLQNELQVNDRCDLSPEELLTSLEKAMPRFLSFRARTARVAGMVPFYAGILGPTTVGFLMTTVFTRDVFMHRIDIARATGRQLAVGEWERVLVADVVRQWGRRSKADARLLLTCDAGGDYVLGSGSRARISGDPLEFCRILTGRADPDVMTVTGDTEAAASWLKTKVVF